MAEYIFEKTIKNSDGVDCYINRGEIARCKDCKHLSSDRIAPEWKRICRKYGCGKSDDGFCDESERKETEDVEVWRQ